MTGDTSLFLPEKQQKILEKYISDRRYKFMMILYLSLAGTIALLFPALLDIHTPRRTMRYSYRRRSRMSSFALWIICAVTFVLYFFRGIGIHFGKNSDLDCARKQNYVFEMKEFGGKDPDSGKAPYYVYDKAGTKYLCPIFLDWKNACEGSRLYCVTLANGKHYAMLEEQALL